MAKHIDLETLKEQGLAHERYVGGHGTEPNPEHPRDLTPSTYEYQREIAFDSQAYQKLEVKEGDIVTIGSYMGEWRIAKVDESAEEVCVFFVLT